LLTGARTVPAQPINRVGNGGLARPGQMPLGGRQEAGKKAFQIEPAVLAGARSQLLLGGFGGINSLLDALEFVGRGEQGVFELFQTGQRPFSALVEGFDELVEGHRERAVRLQVAGEAVPFGALAAHDQLEALFRLECDGVVAQQRNRLAVPRPPEQIEQAQPDPRRRAELAGLLETLPAQDDMRTARPRPE
jgi:hypothetical protein